MDKRIILSVAGSGKTSYIINKLDLESSSLIITYTDNNYFNIKRKIIRKFGFFPRNIKLFTYFTYLYSFCFKPFLLMKYKTKGMSWNFPPFWTIKLHRNDPRYYIDRSKRIYHNRLAKLIEQENLFDLVNQRHEKYFDNLFIDEVQDFAGHDFNLLKSICQSNINVILVGDYYQHTYDTSRDGNVNRNLHNDYEGYKSHFERIGIDVDEDTLSNSHRCSPTICNFVSDELDISISSHREEETSVKLIEDMPTIKDIFNCDKIVKLFYQEHHKYLCYSENWGGSKGQDHYKDVCVVLNNNSFELFKSNELHKLNPRTKNKLYVACTRASNNLYLVPEKLLKPLKLG